MFNHAPINPKLGFACISLYLLVACTPAQAKVPFPFAGSLLLVEQTDTAAQIYAWRTDQQAPVPTWDNLELRIPPATDIPTPLVAPNGAQVILAGRYWVNLLTGEQRDLGFFASATDFEDYAFSPAGHRLAFVRDETLYGLGLDTPQPTVLLPKKCADYEKCGAVCLPLSGASPFWVDDNTLLFFYSAEYDTYAFPKFATNCRLPATEQVMATIAMNGTRSAGFTFGRYTTIMNRFFLPTQPTGGPTLLAVKESDRNFESVFWYETAELRQGLVNPHEITEVNTQDYALSPDGAHLLIFPQRIVELRTGNSTALPVLDQYKRRNIERCVWAPDKAHIACLRQTREEYELFVFSATGDQIHPVNIWQRDTSNSNWALLAWLPE